MTIAIRAAALLLAVPFGLPAEARAPIAAAHQRVLPLQGGQNFRDLGGYRTRDGRTVRWGLLYRSGSMHSLTAADYEYLLRLGIRSVCDFRDTRERTTEPVAWPSGQAPQVFADGYALDMGGIGLKPGAQPTVRGQGGDATDVPSAAQATDPAIPADVRRAACRARAARLQLHGGQGPGSPRR